LKFWKILSLTTIALPGCQTGGSNTPAGLAGVPPLAVSACSARADDFWSATPGTSVVNSAQMSTGKAVGNWQLQMGTGNRQSTCTVNPIGNVINIGPG